MTPSGHQKREIAGGITLNMAVKKQKRNPSAKGNVISHSSSKKLLDKVKPPL
jgi:hypothetical protein